MKKEDKQRFFTLPHKLHNPNPNHNYKSQNKKDADCTVLITV